MLARLLKKIRPFPGSETFWKDRYTSGGNSGAGSYGQFAEFKAEVINGFVSENNIKSVIEFGSGDGAQLKLARYPIYTGFDVSELCVSQCTDLYPAYTFKLMRDYAGEKADLSMSLDVIYHLIEDDVYEHYMRTLFYAGERFVAIYSSNYEGRDAPHVRHRKFTDWVERNARHWSLIRHIPNRYPYEGDATKGTFADFYFYAHKAP